MSQQPSVRCLRRREWWCVFLAVVLAGCATAQARRDDTRSELVETAPATEIEKVAIRLYREPLLPAARIGYETGRSSVKALIDAERSLRTLEIQCQEALAELGQKRAELQRAIGRVPGMIDKGRAR